MQIIVLGTVAAGLLLAVGSAPSLCWAETASREVPPKNLVEAARGYLLGQLPWPPDKIEIRLLSKLSARALPAGRGRVELRAKGPKGRKVFGRVKIVVTIRAGGKLICQVPVLFDVRRVRDVAMGNHGERVV